jgi:ubiquinone/menaquinone biosynthesis C-methylase UbiE
MLNLLEKLSYQTLQEGKTYLSLLHKQVNTQIAHFLEPNLKERTDRIPPEVLLGIKQRLDELVAKDWEDAETGIYPKSVLFEADLIDFFKTYPLLWADTPNYIDRVSTGKFHNFAEDIDTKEFPKYYLQNFHGQTDGYLSEQSAALYDLQVDILFNGAADAMRRRILAPLKQGLAQFFNNKDLTQVKTTDLKILDAACGTGRTLHHLQQTFPHASLYGLELSPAYLKKAQQLTYNSGGLPIQWAQGLVEDLPYKDNWFVGVSCVFLFHELPAPVRQQALQEFARVLQPNGVLVLCDSIQLNDSPEFAPTMENFRKLFHEPYYKNYIRDDISDRLTQAGFVDIQVETHFMSKYWYARKG